MIRFGGKDSPFAGLNTRFGDNDAESGTFKEIENLVIGEVLDDLKVRGAFTNAARTFPLALPMGLSIYKVKEVKMFKVTRPEEKDIIIMAAICRFNLKFGSGTPDYRYMLRFFMSPSYVNGVFGNSFSWMELKHWYIDIAKKHPFSYWTFNSRNFGLNVPMDIPTAGNPPFELRTTTGFTVNAINKGADNDAVLVVYASVVSLLPGDEPVQRKIYSAGDVIGKNLTVASRMTSFPSDLAISGLQSGTKYTVGFFAINRDGSVGSETDAYGSVPGYLYVWTLSAKPTTAHTLNQESNLYENNNKTVRFTCTTLSLAQKWILIRTPNAFVNDESTQTPEGVKYNVGDTFQTAGGLVYTVCAKGEGPFEAEALDELVSVNGTTYTYILVTYNSNDEDTEEDANYFQYPYKTANSSLRETFYKPVSNPVGPKPGTPFIVSLAKDQITIRWVGDTSDYMIIMKEGGPVSYEPLPGTVYSVDDEPYPNEIVKLFGASASRTITFSGFDVTDRAIHFAIWSKSGTNETTNYSLGSHIICQAVPDGKDFVQYAEISDPGPANDVTNLTVIKNGTNPMTSLDVSFDHTADGSDIYYLIMRAKNASLVDSLPVTGTPYSVGSSIGNATVVYIGTNKTFTDSGLEHGKNYAYKVIPFRQQSAKRPSYKTNGIILNVNQWTLNVTPRSIDEVMVNALSSTKNSITFSISIRNVDISDGSVQSLRDKCKLIVLYKKNISAWPVLTNGTFYKNGDIEDSFIVHDKIDYTIGRQVQFTLNDLDPGSTYLVYVKAVYENAMNSPSDANYDGPYGTIQYMTIVNAPSHNPSASATPFTSKSYSGGAFQVRFNWTAVPSGGNEPDAYLVLMKEDQDFTDEDIPENSRYYDVGDFCGKAKVVSIKKLRTSNFADLTGLPAGKRLYFTVISFRLGSGTESISYLRTGFISFNTIAFKGDADRYVSSASITAVNESLEITAIPNAEIVNTVDDSINYFVAILLKQGAISDTLTSGTKYSNGDTVGTSKLYLFRYSASNKYYIPMLDNSLAAGNWYARVYFGRGMDMAPVNHDGLQFHATYFDTGLQVVSVDRPITKLTFTAQRASAGVVRIINTTSGYSGNGLIKVKSGVIVGDPVKFFEGFPSDGQNYPTLDAPTLRPFYAYDGSINYNTNIDIDVIAFKAVSIIIFPYNTVSGRKLYNRQQPFYITISPIIDILND